MSKSIPIHIIYASTSGNTEFVVERIALVWEKLGYKVFLHRAEKTDIKVIEDNKLFLLATSTWDHGSINPFFNNLLSQMKKSNFSGKSAAFIGLGSRKYTKNYFCAGMNLLKEVWEKNEGQSVGMPLPIGREPFDELIIKMIDDWAKKIIKLFENK